MFKVLKKVFPNSSFIERTIEYVSSSQRTSNSEWKNDKIGQYRTTYSSQKPKILSAEDKRRRPPMTHFRDNTLQQYIYSKRATTCPYVTTPNIFVEQKLQKQFILPTCFPVDKISKPTPAIPSKEALGIPKKDSSDNLLSYCIQTLIEPQESKRKAVDATKLTFCLPRSCPPNCHCQYRLPYPPTCPPSPAPKYPERGPYKPNHICIKEETTRKRLNKPVSPPYIKFAVEDSTPEQKTCRPLTNSFKSTRLPKSKSKAKIKAAVRPCASSHVPSEPCPPLFQIPSLKSQSYRSPVPAPLSCPKCDVQPCVDLPDFKAPSVPLVYPPVCPPPPEALKDPCAVTGNTEQNIPKSAGESFVPCRHNNHHFVGSPFLPPLMPNITNLYSEDSKKNPESAHDTTFPYSCIYCDPCPCCGRPCIPRCCCQICRHSCTHCCPHEKRKEKFPKFVKMPLPNGDTNPVDTVEKKEEETAVKENASDKVCSKPVQSRRCSNSRRRNYRKSRPPPTEDEKS